MPLSMMNRKGHNIWGIHSGFKLGSIHKVCVGVWSGHPLKYIINSRISVIAKMGLEKLKTKYLGSRKNPQKSVKLILPIRFKCDRLDIE